MAKKISESEFKKMVMAELLRNGVVTIDLGSGTFDLFLDEGKRCFLELKLANPGYKRRAKESGITLKPQTKALRAMKNMPIVLVCNRQKPSEFYVVLPKDVNKFVQERGEYPHVLVGVKHLKSSCPFEEALSRVVTYVRGK